MRRRTIIQGLSSLAAMLAARPSLAPARPRYPAIPNWSQLRARVGRRLLKIEPTLARLARSGKGDADAFFARIQNPYLLGDDPALTQSFGWAGAWSTQASDYAVAAQSAADVAAAILFARRNHLRLVVKGGGHSYFGNSNGANSLLIWTRRMNEVEIHDRFRPRDAPPGFVAVPAVSVGAGALWGPVYHKVSVENGRYVQGGGCLTVGVSGFTLGGGFGSFSKAFGTGAANLLEAEMVTADGEIRRVSEWRHPELFFALKGGGGGSFGVVTRLTMRTHDLPETFGAVMFEVQARSDAAWRALVDRMIAFYAETLFNPTWGEQIRFNPGRTMGISLLFQGIGEPEARTLWKPMLDWMAARPSDFVLKADPLFLGLPARRFWDPDFLRSLPGIVLSDDRPGAPASSIYWATNRSEAAQVLHAYQSAWIPADLLEPGPRTSLVDALVNASAEWSVTLHTNKGLAGGADDARSRTRNTATNPEVLDAFALLICAAEGPPAWPGIPGYEPDVARSRAEAAGVERAMAPIYRLVPGAGAYMSEANYFQRGWKNAYWGGHYSRLAAAKRRYDPKGLFRVHHGVEGS